MSIQSKEDGASTSDASASSCPVPEQYRNEAVYNVYNQRIDEPGGTVSGRHDALGTLNPLNQMPTEPNQQPCPGQRKLLPTARIPSAIPKGGTDSTWLYPSPQMFYNGRFSGLCVKGCCSVVPLQSDPDLQDQTKFYHTSCTRLTMAAQICRSQQCIWSMQH